MNVKLRKVFDFSSGVVYNSLFHVNYYTATVEMTTVSNDPNEHNIAYERMKWWVDFVLGDSILIQDTEPLIKQWINTEQRIIVLPEQPVDQLIGIMMYLKLSAITEGRVAINRVDVESTLGDSVAYIHYADENPGPLSINGWWNDHSPSWLSAKTKSNRNNNIIKIGGRSPSWADLDLSFEEQQEPNDQNRIVFVDFLKNEKK